jgi:ATP-dependent helicase/nuclease subunit A
MLSGYVSLATAPDAADGQEPADALYDFAAAQIEKLVLAAPQASVGVLVRTNSVVARLIYLLRQRDIPASEEGGNPLIDSPAVELILSLLRLADHPGDTTARFHLANSPLAKALELIDHTNDAVAARMSQDLRRQLLEAGYGATVYAWARKLAASCDTRDLSRLQQLVELAYDFQSQSTLRPGAFVRLVEHKRIADPTSSPVRVMTIHQAKGLQFDAVVLPELTANLTGQRETFVAGRPSATEPFHMVCRSANANVRQFFPPALQALFDDDTRSEVTESLCVLYVAMTRAVHALYMILPPAKSNERTLPKSFGGLLRATLAEGKPTTGGQLLYEHGDANWWRSLPAVPVGQSSKADSTRSAPATISLAPPAARCDRGLERTSPSSLEGGARIPAVNVLRAKSTIALNTGTLFHAWFEQIEWLEDGPPTDETLRQIAARLRHEIGDFSQHLTELIARFRLQLAAPAVAAALKRSFYTARSDEPPQAIRERQFAIRTGDELLSGSIDRLIVLRRGGKPIAADILDFKTDELPAADPAALADKIEFYRPQLDAYRTAAAHLLRLDPGQITSRLVFLSLGAVEQLGHDRN